MREREFASRLEGRTCVRLQVQQYWYAGTLATEWNVFFLELDDGGHIRFFFDAGVFFWREEGPSLPPHTEESEYRLVEPAESSVLRGRRIREASFAGTDGQPSRKLSIAFEGGLSLVLRHQDDDTSVLLDRLGD